MEDATEHHFFDVSSVLSEEGSFLASNPASELEESSQIGLQSLCVSLSDLSFENFELLLVLFPAVLPVIVRPSFFVVEGSCVDSQ